MDNFVGRASLRAGLEKYVAKFAYKNTVLDDLVECFDGAIKE